MTTESQSNNDFLPAHTEHYCTLFDSAYLPQGLALHTSLAKHDPESMLWALCLDDAAYHALSTLNIPSIIPIRLADIESAALLKAKSERSHGEYCWTLTPFLPAFLLDKGSSISRITYVDADCYFFSSPKKILNKFAHSGKSVLITPHGYSSEYDQSEVSGIFCVQFLTFNNSLASKNILSWWQDRCLEWCGSTPSNGLFGDQKYLDQWPELFSEEVHILDDVGLTLAPWNVEERLTRNEDTCLYHFHGFRVQSRHRAQLFFHYKLKRSTIHRIYQPYLRCVAEQILRIEAEGIEIPYRSSIRSIGSSISRTIHAIRGELRTGRLV